MKTIYTFTMQKKNIDSDFDNKLRLLAYMLYDSIYNYYGEGEIPLNLNDNIEYNKINENSVDRTYKFNSEFDENENGYYYEPFLIGENSFGLTIIDDKFNIEIIRRLLNENMRLLNISQPVNIKTFCYDAVDVNDETNREFMVRNIMEQFGVVPKKRNWFETFFGNGKQNKKGSQRR